MSRNRIRGITVEIGGDTTKLDKALAGTNKQLSTTQQSLKDVERLLKLDPGNAELLAQKQRLLAQAADNTAKKLDTLKQAARNADQALQRGKEYQAKYEPLKAELDSVSASLKGLEANEASMREKLDAGQISTRQYEAFAQKLEETRKRHKELQQAVKDLDQEFAGAKMDQGQYDALQRELEETERQVKDTQKSFKDCSSGLDEFERKAGNVSKKAKDVSKELAPVTKAIGALGAAAIATVPETEEFRADLSMLDNNARQAGVGIDAARQAFQNFNTVSGETDSSIEAVSNLLQAGFTESNLQRAVEGLANAAITFPDTLKIESLADSLQETLATGTATGQFAELLDRVGYGAENFSQNLAFCTTELDKQKLALSVLVDGPLKGAYDGWQKNNQGLVESRDASLELQTAIAQLAESIQPIMTDLVEFATQFLDWFNSLDDGTKRAIVGILGVTAAISPMAGLEQRVYQWTHSARRNYKRGRAESTYGNLGAGGGGAANGVNGSDATPTCEGGAGADAVTPKTPDKIGTGGTGGSGGGGGGAGGNGFISVEGNDRDVAYSKYQSGMPGGPGGRFGKGSTGAPGGIILYYGEPKVIVSGPIKERNNRQFLDQYGRRFIV